ncbi:MAG: cbb3-type cytochrome oxidase assembly protein CcoS [Phycisphaerales bacterium]|nr:cbb3-type cytochrome oxidase assembly protein CcoS [Phycisphaerales bacterium]
MEVLVIVLPIALLMGAGSLWVFVRCVRSGQYDDLDTPPLRVLSDEKRVGSDGGRGSDEQSSGRGCSER